MKKRIRLFFCDFWEVFNPEDNYFLDLLNDEYDIQITDNKPDFLFYSVFGTKFRRFNCKRIFFTGENIRPDFSQCDYAFSFDYSENPHNYRLPLYALFGDSYKLTAPKDVEKIAAGKTKFCNFIYSNPGPKIRNIFFNELSKYKKVDSAGRYMNNTGVKIRDKREFIRDYKFTISFENQCHPGYTTEKIIDAMFTGSIAVYWGNPLIGNDFNTKSFINSHEFGSMEELIERIIQVDRDDDLYLQYLSEPYFTDNRINRFIDKENIKQHLNFIFQDESIPVSSHSAVFSGNKLKRGAALFYIDGKYKWNRICKSVKYFRFIKLKYKIEDLLKGKPEIKW